MRAFFNGQGRGEERRGEERNKCKGKCFTPGDFLFAGTLPLAFDARIAFLNYSHKKMRYKGKCTAAPPLYLIFLWLDTNSGDTGKNSKARGKPPKTANKKWSETKKGKAPQAANLKASFTNRKAEPAAKPGRVKGG